MNKSIIQKEINQRLKREKMFISPGKLREITGFGLNKVTGILDGLDYLEDGKGKKYLVSEVAQRIADLRQN